MKLEHDVVIAFQQEATLKENEANVLRKQIEREFLEKVKLEDMIMDKMREQLTADKASQYTKKVTDKVRRRATELVSYRPVFTRDGYFALGYRIFACFPTSKVVLQENNSASKFTVFREILRKIDTIFQPLSCVSHYSRSYDFIILALRKILMPGFFSQERAMADVENEISTDILEISNATSRVRRLQDTLTDINGEIHQKNDTISRIENEIVKRNAVIEKKQGTIDQYNKKIDQILLKEGVRNYIMDLISIWW